MKVYLLFALLIPVTVQAQPLTDNDLQSLVDAEWAFINMAREKNTRDAFITFLADSAVTFGAAPRKGKTHLEKQSVDETWLYWEPEYSDIDASGNFGFNTGPWEFRKSRSSGEALAYGHFISVWQKENGAWRVIIDIGIAHTKPEEKKPWSTSSMQLKNLQGVSKSPMQRVIAEEQKFLKEYSAKRVAAYPGFLSSEARIFRHQFQPLSSAEYAVETPRAKDFRFMDGNISPSGDLAFVYGQALIEILDNGKPKSLEGNYLRIWKKEDGKNWKIVVDVLSYL